MDNQQPTPFASQPGMMMFPPPWMFSQQDREQRRAEIPPRVLLALRYLNELTEKQSVNKAREVSIPRGDVGQIEMRGQVLSKNEEQTQALALDLLNQYFTGKLKEADWDKPIVDGEEKTVLPISIDCPMCRGSSLTRPNCQVCGSAGKVHILRMS